MIDRLTKIQLGIFAVITAITLTVMAIFYLRLPATFGIGTYGVSADFVAGGGLYKNANVTYRGVAVGRVESVGLNPSGVTADMRLNSGTSIPSNVTATVKSVSAVGEQYIDLVPPSTPSSVKLRNGSRIERRHEVARAAARDVHRGQRLRPRTGQADRVSPIAGRRGQRQLSASLGVDRPGRPVPAGPDPRRC
jgi:ABC-type transporter Mla subunit MlaD